MTTASNMRRQGHRAALAMLVTMVYAVPAPSRAQTVADSRLWLGVSAQGSIGDASPWAWSSDSLLRTRDFAGTLDTVGQRVVASRRIGLRAAVGAGYQINGSYRSDSDTRIEQRLMQQVTWGRLAGRTSISLRARLEQRWIEGDDRTAVRLRGQARLAVPVPATRNTTLVLADEVFLHANRTAVVDRGFDNHRLYAGLRRSISPSMAVDVGYYNIYSHGRSGVNRRSHVLSVQFGVSR